jgi:hypothetical protein
VSQYRVGTVEVTNGSATVTAVDPDPGSSDYDEPHQWLSNVAVGDLFIVAGTDVFYEVLTVNSDIQLTLVATYQGTTVTASGTPNVGAHYAIVRDFTTNYLLPELSRGDIETANVVSRALQGIDAELDTLESRIAALEP